MALEAAQIRSAMGQFQPVVLPGSKRASVALLLRHGEDGLEMFFIKRATRPGDRWSGDVAFPGGKQEAGESEIEAAKREVMEEVGLDLYQGGAWQCLGHLNDRQALELTVRCYIFLEGLATTQPLLKLQEGEVAGCGWCPLGHLCRPTREVQFSRGWARQRFDGKAARLSLPMALLSTLQVPRLLGLHEFRFNAVDLPLRDVMLSVDRVPSKLPHEGGAFRLWGLTLGMVNEFLVVTGLRPHADPFTVYVSQRLLGVRLERCIHASAVQSVLLKVMTSILTRCAGRSGASPFQVSRWLLYFEAAALLPAAVALVRLLAGLRQGRMANLA